MDLRNKNVLITGAAKRIGREIALSLARRKANIFVHYHRSGRAAAALCKEICAASVRAEMAACDFSRATETRVRSFWRTVENKIGPVDILINNASLYVPAVFGKIREKDWNEMMNVNLKAPFFLSQEAGRGMLKRKSGKIINLLDWAIEQPRQNYLAYTASKAGLQALTVGLASELAPHVQVNGIAPGPILPVRGATAKENARVSRQTLAKRFGSPQDIAVAVLYLIEGGDYVTGAVIPVDGGKRGA